VTLPPYTPIGIVDMYRAAFADMIQDPEFLARAQKFGNLTFRSHDDVEFLLKTLANTPPEAMAYVSKMLQNQGLQVE
jgi:hypothetical protein